MESGLAAVWKPHGSFYPETLQLQKKVENVDLLLRTVRSSEDWLILGKTKLKGIILAGETVVIYSGWEASRPCFPQNRERRDVNSLGSWGGGNSWVPRTLWGTGGAEAQQGRTA